MKTPLMYFQMMARAFQHIYQNIYRVDSNGNDRITAAGDQRITADSDY